MSGIRWDMLAAWVGFPALCWAIIAWCLVDWRPLVGILCVFAAWVGYVIARQDVLPRSQFDD